MTAADLFDYAESVRRRDEGMRLAAAHSPRFADEAFEAIKRVALRQVHVHVDDIIAECTARPAHPNAWGQVWTRAIREGVIQRTNQTRPSRDPAKHAHRYAVYFSLIFDPRGKP
jgi:hypothetical protein